MKGKYVVIEGGEGTGKTTTINDVLKMIKESGDDSFIYTREPGGLEVSEKLRNIVVNDQMEAATEVLIYAASRSEYIRKKLIPLLGEGKNILSDRSFITSFVYQGLVKGEDIDEIIEINKYAIKNKTPDIVIVFDAKPSVGLNRISENNREECNKFDRESIDFHEKVRQSYLQLKDYEEKLNTEIFYIDASLEREERAKLVIEILKEKNCLGGIK